jgi:hypothetical protein
VWTTSGSWKFWGNRFRVWETLIKPDDHDCQPSLMPPAAHSPCTKDDFQGQICVLRFIYECRTTIEEVWYLGSVHRLHQLYVSLQRLVATRVFQSPSVSRRSLTELEQWTPLKKITAVSK